MPFTPFHFGPGLLIKAIAPARFSFTAYAATQVVIDIESGYYLFTRQYPVHRILHTFVAGAVVGAAVGGMLALAGRKLPPDAQARLRGEIAPRSAAAGGIVGGLMHSLLDGIMHIDIQPWRPFSSVNWLHRSIDTGTLHLLCLATGLVGAALLVLRSQQTDV